MTDQARIAAANPFHIDLEQQKKRAKELKRAVAGGDAGAWARIAALRPRWAVDDAHPFRLADAQWVIARELGLSSWPALKAHVAELDGAGADIRSGAAPLDHDIPTLHIRCGNDISEALVQAGFSGRFLEYSNPFCVGPVVAGEDWIERRIRFVTDAYAGSRGEGESEVRAKLEAEEESLRRVSDYGRVVLWFEHDSYDQLILMRLLSYFYFAGHVGRPLVELVSIDSFPGGEPFRGLGQLPPEALYMLWRRRAPVTEAQFVLGARAWDALRAPDPTDLRLIAESGASALPFLSRALLRHLQELPDRALGLSRTERAILTILSQQGACPAGQVFSLLVRHHEPLPWLGDLMFWHLLHEMSLAGQPPLEIKEDGAWPQREVSLTLAGARCLDGKVDYLALQPPERWVGGVAIRGGERVWRWDGEARRPLRV